MAPGVDEILRIINDFDRRAAVDRQLDAVLGGQGVLDDLLRAVGVDKNRHSAGFHVGNRNFHLGLPRALGQLHLDGGGGIAVAGSLDLHGSLHRLAILLSGLNGLAAEGGLRRGLAVLVGLHRAGGAVSGLGLGDGAAVGIGRGLGSAAVLGGSGLHLGAVLLGLRLGDGAVVILGSFGLDCVAAGGIPVRGGTAATAAGADGVEGHAAGGSVIIGGVCGGKAPGVFGVGLDLGGGGQGLAVLVHPLDRAGGPTGIGLQRSVLQRLIRGGDPGVDGLAGGLRLVDGDAYRAGGLGVGSAVGGSEFPRRFIRTSVGLDRAVRPCKHALDILVVDIVVELAGELDGGECLTVGQRLRAQRRLAGGDDLVGDGDGDVGALGIAVRREGDAVGVPSHREIGGQLINRLRCPIDQLECTTDCIPLARKLARALSGAACGQLDAVCCAIGYGR